MTKFENEIIHNARMAAWHMSKAWDLMSDLETDLGVEVEYNDIGTLAHSINRGDGPAALCDQAILEHLEGIMESKQDAV